MVKPLVGPCRCCGGKVSSEAHTCPHCGQPEPFPHSWAAEARQYLAQGQKINAIKAVRDGTGMGLKEAKDLVESWDQ